ncbi:hypothetical protein COU74_05180 [Candidatus Peregrinibacteria bacterium CG10_big_fil_rev_8_21_14_0_10_36_19]|nr:MAG: hypothetical protein COU74_05180 [Candidatus Peregrinibacteria bacterium CG10_big_fil_rev_8_21_14_0_10_36_19]
MKKIVSFLTAITVMVSMSTTAFAADNKLPSDVENLQGKALNASASLTWNAATDDVGVAGYQVHYGLKSVSQPGQSYDFKLDVGNVLKYTVNDLVNSKTYYFSVVAYDAAGNESGKWAKELSLTPTASAGSDTEAPKVAKAEAINIEEVKVVFSEAIVLPTENPEDAFTIEHQDTFALLSVLDAKMDETDKTGKTVILTTKRQAVGSVYTLTAGIDIKDKAGNPIVSGTSDEASFDSSSVEKASDQDGPQMLEVTSIDESHIVVNFNEAVVLDIDPAANFSVFEKDDNTKTKEVVEVAMGKNKAGLDNAATVLKIDGLESGKTYVVTAVDLKDEAGNVVAASKSSIEFSLESNEEDTTPPKDVTSFVAKAVAKAQKYIVTLTWKNPPENKDDTKNQIVYVSEDQGKTYTKKTDLDSLSNKYEVGEYEPGEYWFKLSQTDAANNESEGAIAKLTLSETGPGMIGLALASLGMSTRFRKKKK